MTQEEAKKYIKEFVPNDEIINSVDACYELILKLHELKML